MPKGPWAGTHSIGVVIPVGRAGSKKCVPAGSAGGSGEAGKTGVTQWEMPVYSDLRGCAWDTGSPLQLFKVLSRLNC